MVASMEYEYTPENCPECEGKGWGGGEDTDGETCPGCGLAGEMYRASVDQSREDFVRSEKLIRTTNRDDLRSSHGRVGRYYQWKNEFYISVTNAIKNGLPAPALMYWTGRTVAEFVADNLDEVVDLAGRMDRSELVTFLKNQPWKKRDKAGDIGSTVHELAEAYALGQPVDLSQYEPKIQALARQFVDFMDTVKPDIYAIEGVVFNREHRYAGAFDFIFDFDYPEGILTGRSIVDVKTGSGIYPEAALQQTAYRHGEFIAVGDEEVPMPEVDGAFCLHLRPKSWKLIPVVTSDTSWQVFLSCLETARWVHNDGMGGKEQSVGIPYLSSSDDDG